MTTDTSAAETSASETSTPETGTSETGAPQTQEPGAGAKKSSPVGRPRNPVTIVLTILLIAALAATGFFGYQYFFGSGDSAAADQDNSAVIDVATDYAIKLSSFDYRDLDMNREAITAASTPEFADKYGEMLTALTEIVQNGQGEATAEVSHSAVESIGDNSATVLLFVDQNAKNVVSPDGRVQPYRMVVTLEKMDDRWLVGNVETR